MSFIYCFPPSSCHALKETVHQQFCHQTVDISHWLPYHWGFGCLVSHILQNIFFVCSTEDRNSGFGTTWGWVNDDRMEILGWTVPLNVINQALQNLGGDADIVIGSHWPHVSRQVCGTGTGGCWCRQWPSLRRCWVALGPNAWSGWAVGERDLQH